MRKLLIVASNSEFLIQVLVFNYRTYQTSFLKLSVIWTLRILSVALKSRMCSHKYRKRSNKICSSTIEYEFHIIDTTADFSVALRQISRFEQQWLLMTVFQGSTKCDTECLWAIDFSLIEIQKFSLISYAETCGNGEHWTVQSKIIIKSLIFIIFLRFATFDAVARWSISFCLMCVCGKYIYKNWTHELMRLHLD